MRRILFSILVFLFCNSFSKAQSTSYELDSLLQHHYSQGYFEGVVLVADKNKKIFEWVCGFADREDSKELTMETKFPIGELTKHLTAIVVLGLIEDETISFETTIDDLLPYLEIPRGDQITVRELLNNTSGLPDEKESIYEKRNSPRIVIERAISDNSKYKAETSDKNNIDYMILGLMVEQKLGQSFEQVMKEKLIDPLSLVNTGFLLWDDLGKKVATGYVRSDSAGISKASTFHIENYLAAGAMYSNAYDLFKIDKALHSGKILNDSSLELLYGLQSDDRTAFGCETYTYPFSVTYPIVVECKSTLGGFRISWIRLPEIQRTIIVLSNHPKFEIDTFGDLSNLKEQILIRIAPCGNEHIEPCGW